MGHASAPSLLHQNWEGFPYTLSTMFASRSLTDHLTIKGLVGNTKVYEGLALDHQLITKIVFWASAREFGRQFSNSDLIIASCSALRTVST